MQETATSCHAWAQVVENMAALDTYPWCGHCVLMGRRIGQWQDDAFVLRLFHEKKGLARKAYAAFVEKGVASGHRPDLVGGGLVRSAGGWIAVQSLKRERFASDERILGGSEFVLSVLARSHERYEAQKSAAGRGFDLPELVAAVCDIVDLDKGVLASPVKECRVSRIRAIIAHIAFDTLRLRGVDIARHLALGPSAVSRLARRGRRDPLSDEIGRASSGGRGNERMSTFQERPLRYSLSDEIGRALFGREGE